jgi:choline transport protein
MIASWIINAVSSFGFMILLLFFMGDPTTALDSATGWPIIQICWQAAKQLQGANTLMAMIVISGIVSYFNNMASISRLTWAFGKFDHTLQLMLLPHADGFSARDDGLPFSEALKVVSSGHPFPPCPRLTKAEQVHPSLRMPVNALMATTLITVLLLLVPIGSGTAFNAILSLSILALYVSYTMPCIFVFLQRISGEEVVHSAWSLGRWGVWVNGAASVYGLFIIIFLCFPSELSVTAANMNWAGPTGIRYYFCSR